MPERKTAERLLCGCQAHECTGRLFSLRSPATRGAPEGGAQARLAGGILGHRDSPPSIRRER
jgi:hypothetical protein